ncbi:phenylcoumaran benzylic ether reductase POP1-like isoform X2 [Gastrolobium bilobum]|uniref:phenylcoumaran benzylic ether reductase POP1-like isoform X2 n=1 Tax=Gastrolobium bilobum TaxID=150636 RepID=UPI002AAFA49B|nr:phenylcoumaran benzylic ether reductase POP1-like isoform X2 [Gastrolobium bilobum]
MAAAFSKILIIGGTGYIGKFIVEASVMAGHPTYLLVRESPISNPVKATMIEKFKNLGVKLVLGDINDHESLVKAIKQVDVVISAVSYMHLPVQFKIISAIKEAGNVKRFFPSEFGNDVDRAHGMDEATNIFATKAQIRRTIEAEGIPYTYVVANFFIGHFLPNWSDLRATASPLDIAIILGDGNPKVIFNKEEDVATYTIKAVDDPRTLNKSLYIRPPANTLSFNDLVFLWDKKIESSFPMNMGLSICHAAYVKGDHTNYEIEPSFGVEASELYPDVKYTTVDEFIKKNDACTPFYLHQFISIKDMQIFY